MYKLENKIQPVFREKVPFPPLFAFPLTCFRNFRNFIDFFSPTALFSTTPQTGNGGKAPISAARVTVLPTGCNASNTFLVYCASTNAHANTT